MKTYKQAMKELKKQYDDLGENIKSYGEMMDRAYKQKDEIGYVNLEGVIKGIVYARAIILPILTEDY